MNNIKKYRGLRQLQQKELADLIGVARTRMSYYEGNSCRNVPPRVLKALEKHLNVSKIKILGISNLRYLPETEEDLEYLLETIKTWYGAKKRR